MNVFGLQVNRRRPGHAYVPTVGLWGVSQPYPRDFLEAAVPIRDRGDTLLDLPRLYVLWQAVRNTCTRDAGAIAEVGVYKGGSVELMAAGKAGRQVYAYDTFSGHPADAISEHDSVHRFGMFSDLDPVAVGRRLEKLGICVVVGEFNQRAPILSPRFSVVHLDTDLYQPTLDGLLCFAPRMTKACVIVVDDYGSIKANGVRKAVDCYLQAHIGRRFQMWTMQTKQAVLIARA